MLYHAGRLLTAALSARGVPARSVDPGSADLDDLLLVVRYGVVERAVVVLRDKSGLRGRLTRLPAPEELLSAIARIQQSATPRA